MRTAILIGRKNPESEWSALGPLNEIANKTKERFRKVLKDSGNFGGVFYPEVSFCLDGQRWHKKKFKPQTASVSPSSHSGNKKKGKGPVVAG